MVINIYSCYFCMYRHTGAIVPRNCSRVNVSDQESVTVVSCVDSR
jgi:hypothetical protein